MSNVIRGRHAPRTRGRLAVIGFGTLAGCQLIAGLSGDRDLLPPHAARGGTSGTNPALPGEGGSPSSVGSAEEIAGMAGAIGTLGTGGLTGGTGHANHTSRGGGGGQRGGDAGRAATSGATTVAVAGGEGGVAGERADAGAANGGSEETSQPLASPSCADPAPACAEVDPCVTSWVPGGTFQMGRSEEPSAADYFSTGNIDEVPAHEVSVSGYWLDKYEVTVGRFRRFLAAYDGTFPVQDAGAHPAVPGSGWEADWNQWLPANAAALEASLGVAEPDNTNMWTPAPGSHECRPINYVDWYVAFAFCIWDGGRLPSEAEWEFAAAGGEQERLFPWGTAAADTAHSVFACLASGTSDCATDDLPHVGSRGQAGLGRFGHADLGGSVAEYVRDIYQAQFYGYPMIATGTDVINLSTDVIWQQSPVRGGAFDSHGGSLRGAARGIGQRATGISSVGFRCARNP